MKQPWKSMITVIQITLTLASLLQSRTSALVYPEYEICPSRTETIQQKSNFIIRHNTQTSQGGDQTCTLTLSGFTSGGYVALLGVAEVGSGDPCPGGLQKININSETYCVDDNLKVDALRLYGTTEMTISINASFQNFAVKVYSNYVRCGTNAVIDSATLSGVISSAIPGTVKVDHDSCSTTISGLPRGSIVKLRKLLFAFTGSGQVRINDGAAENANDRTLNISGTALELNYIPDMSEDGSLTQFTLLYTVLVCENPPAVDKANVISSLPSGPYLVGSVVSQYACEDNFIFKDPNSTSIRCIVDDMKAQWTFTDNIKCIPVPQCLEEPKIVPNTKQSRLDDKTVQYTCAEGYPGSQDSIDIKCSSADPEQSPWAWGDNNVGTTLNCTPVECSVPESFFRNITHGTVAVNTTYTYQERLNVMCDFTYAQNPEEIVCTSDGTWSGMSTCLSTKCVWESDIAIDNGDILHTDDSRYYVDGEVQYSCEEGYEQSGSITCLRSGQFSTDEIKCKKENDPMILITILVPISVIITLVVLAVGLILRKRRNAAKPEQRVTSPEPPTESSEYYTMPSLGAPPTHDTSFVARNILQNQGITGSQYEALDLTHRSRGHVYSLPTTALLDDNDAKSYEQLNLSGRNSNEYASVSTNKEQIYVNLKSQE